MSVTVTNGCVFSDTPIDIMSNYHGDAPSSTSEYDISSDGKFIVYAFQHSETSLWNETTHLYLCSLSTDETQVKSLPLTFGITGSKIQACFSDDSRYLAFVNHEYKEGSGSIYQIILLDLFTREQRTLLSNYEFPIERLTWSPYRPDRLLFTAYENARCLLFISTSLLYCSNLAVRLFYLPVQGGVPQYVTDICSISSFQVLSENKMVFVKSSFTEPPNIFMANLFSENEDVVQLTDLNKDALGQLDIALYPPQELSLTCEDQRVIQAWYFPPRSLASQTQPSNDKKYPLVVFVHGGPDAVAIDEWSQEISPQILLLGSTDFECQI